MSYVDITMDLGDFDQIRRKDWDVDPDANDGESITITVQTPGWDQVLNLVFDHVEQVRDFSRRVADLAALGFESGHEIVLRRDGSVRSDGTYPTSEDVDAALQVATREPRREG